MPAPHSTAFSGYNRPMLRYLYLDYGGLAKYRRELKYSLISLRQDWPRMPLDRGLYRCARALCQLAGDGGGHCRRRSRPGRAAGFYHHRIKPAVVLDALARFAGPVCFLDSDSIMQPGFHAEVRRRWRRRRSGR